VDLLAISLLVRWLLGWALCLRMPRLPHARVQGQPSVSVLIPARNEEHTLPKLLSALHLQGLTPMEVIVIDDHSGDRTAAIAAEAGVRVIQPPPLAEGWCGKTWALHHGVRASAGKLLLFLDADTEPHPEFLKRLVAAQQELGGLVSVQPFHRTEKPYEQLSVLFNLVGLMAVPMGKDCGVAFGPAMATSRADYDHIGGHAAVAGKVALRLYEGRAFSLDSFLKVLGKQRGLAAWHSAPVVAFGGDPGGR
jgi:glycosyltransferase involved in cell wall biosynthesis